MSHGYIRHRERTAMIDIDAEALRHNPGIVREHAPSSKVMAVIEANAYGHDVFTAASRLDSADAFAVAMPAEAELLYTASRFAIDARHGDPEGVKYRDVFHQSRSLRDHLAPR